MGGGGEETLGLSESLDFQHLSHFQHFGVRVEIYLIVLKRSMLISADIFGVLFRYFLEFWWELDNNNRY